MSALGRLYRGENQIDFVRWWRIGVPLSLVLVVASLVIIPVRGLNRGIEFEGGTSLEVQAAETSVADARDALRPVGADDATIQIIGSDTIRVRTSIDDPDRVLEIRNALADEAGVEVNEVSVQTVGPSWGRNVTDKAIRALVWFFVVIALYITIRLEWKMAAGALVAVVHDIVVSVGAYALFQFEVTPATVVAYLTILGYSLYDTIVVYDKVHEITARVGSTGRYTYTEMMNLALNRVLMRSVNTTFTSLVPVLSMLVVGSVLLGATTLQEFAIALAIGLASGAWSSIFVAAPVVTWLKEREPANRDNRRRLEAKGAAEGTGTRMVSRDDQVLGGVGARPSRAPTATGTSAPADRPRPSGAIPPRPRKKPKR